MHRSLGFLAATTAAALLAPLRNTAAQYAKHDEHDAHASITAANRGQFGAVAFANSGAAAAQPAFLRGLALLHNFQYDEAAQAFREAERLDPQFAMAYWGEAMTYNHGIWREQDSAAARGVLARLGATQEIRAAKAPTPRERDYLHTLDVLYDGAGAKAARDTAYAVAMAQLAERYPTDVDAQLFHALALLSLFPRTDSTYLRAAAIAERVMREHPQHPGALHYVIHAYDDPAHARLGLAAARGYSRVAPDAPHAQHMTSHIFIAMGMWDDVVAANEHAISMNDGASASVVMRARCGHAGMWLQYAYLQQGRLADARRMMDECRVGGANPDALAGFALMRLRYVIDVEQPEHDVIGTASNAFADSSRLPPNLRFVLDYTTALDALRRGETATAVAALEGMRSAHEALAARARTAASPPEPLLTMPVREGQIRGLLALRRGQIDSAIATLRAAATAQDALPFAFGPPEVQKPSHELLADVLLAAGRPAEAKREYEIALGQTPGRAATLLGLARASRAAGDSAGATRAYAQLASNWHRADPTIPALGEVRRGAGARMGPGVGMGGPATGAMPRRAHPKIAGHAARHDGAASALLSQ